MTTIRGGPGKQIYGGETDTGGSSAPTSGIAAEQQGGAGNQSPWLFPSSDFLNFQKYGSVGLPAIGSTAQILTFTVPNGRYGKITGLGIDFVSNGGAAYTQGVMPFQLTFALDYNNIPFTDFGSFNYCPGSASSPLGMAGLMIKENQVITLAVTNNTIVQGAQFVEALIQGYYYSKNLQPKGMSYQ